MEYGAIDLHTKESEIRIVTAAGHVVLHRRVATTRAGRQSRPNTREAQREAEPSDAVAARLLFLAARESRHGDRAPPRRIT
jgi:hypothetical protein